MFELWMSYRYLMAKKDRFISIINLVSILGIAIGVGALIVVIAVMAGFNHDLREKIIGTTAHILIEKEIGIKDYTNVRQELDAIDGIIGSSGYIHGNVFLHQGKRAASIVLRGVEPTREASVTKINEYLLNDAKIENLKLNEVIIGKQLARFYGYQVGDEISILSPASGVKGEGWKFKFKIVAIFDSGMFDFDRNLIVVHIDQAQEIFRLDSNIATGISVKLKDVYRAKEIKSTILDKLGLIYLVRTWMESNANFFAALKLEKFAMFIILTLIVLVASFNIISTLIVTVTSKTKDIGILKSIGVTRKSIRRIFTLQGLYLGLVGTFWGLVFGVGIVYVLENYDFIKLPEDIYYIDRLPVLLQTNDVLIIVGSAILISYLATIYPSAKAASLQPVEALRYE